MLVALKAWTALTLKKVTKIRMPPACVMKLLSDGKRTSWSGEDEHVSRKFQTWARHICLATDCMVAAWLSRASCLDQSDPMLKIAQLRDLKHRT